MKDTVGITKAQCPNGAKQENEMSEWQPIETAPKDGRPVWVRGNDWGEDAGPNHYGWAYFDSGKWMWPAPVAEGGEATYLTHWLPTQEST